MTVTSLLQEFPLNRRLTRDEAVALIHGDREMTPQAMEAIIVSAGRIPRQRTTLYGEAGPERHEQVFRAANHQHVS